MHNSNNIVTRATTHDIDGRHIISVSSKDGSEAECVAKFWPGFRRFYLNYSSTSELNRITKTKTKSRTKALSGSIKTPARCLGKGSKSTKLHVKHLLTVIVVIVLL